MKHKSQIIKTCKRFIKRWVHSKAIAVALYHTKYLLFFIQKPFKNYVISIIDVHHSWFILIGAAQVRTVRFLECRWCSLLLVFCILKEIASPLLYLFPYKKPLPCRSSNRKAIKYITWSIFSATKFSIVERPGLQALRPSADREGSPTFISWTTSDVLR